MPRRQIPFLPDCYYHIYNRGNNRQLVFFEPENYICFLNGIKSYVLPAADLIAYCLMPTHYHLMIRVKPTNPGGGADFGALQGDSQDPAARSETPEVSGVSSDSERTSEVLKTSEVSGARAVSTGMMKLSVSYTKAINKRFGRLGSLFQGAFQARAITDSHCLLQLCIYIHANPVKDGLVTDPSNWPYSNYLEWLGERQGTLVDREFIRSQFPDPQAYRRLLGDYSKTRRMPEPVSIYLNELETWPH